MKALPTPAQVSATQIIMRIESGEPVCEAISRVIMRAYVLPKIAESAVEYAREHGVISKEAT